MPWSPSKPYYPPHVYLNNRAYFITAGTLDHQPFLATDEAKSVLRDELRAAIKQLGIRLFAWVILDNHYHILVYIERKDQLVPFIKRLHSITAIRLNKQQAKPGRRVWRNYWDYCPRNERDFYRVFNYIHINPVKHGALPEPAGSQTRLDNMFGLSAEAVLDLHERLLGYSFSSYPYYVRKYGRDGMAAIWLDYPIPGEWVGDDF